ncbi:PH domain-containing protein [Microbacterium terrisoli]|uniref:PH domain-containing protein n=1 Tax=Microbacterium terrisoli TaxID=3242192 RepID=UPI00351D68A1
MPTPAEESTPTPRVPERATPPAEPLPADAGLPTPHDRPADPVLSVATFERVLEPRSENRLPLGDGTWYQLARSYVWVRLISVTAMLVLVLVAAAVLTAFVGEPWPWVPGGIAAVVFALTAIITPRQARSFGYQLRADDMVFRRGILWQRMVAVPYGRMQLVDITHGPLDRAFGIAHLKLVTAAASTGVEIPGLTQAAAETLRDTLIEVAETRRTGL